MNSKPIQRAKTARKLGIGLVALGLLPIAWFIASTLQPALPPLPSIPGTEALPSLHRLPWIAPALLYVLPSCLLMWMGAAIAGRQKAVFEAEQRAAEDRLRRVREY